MVLLLVLLLPISKSSKVTLPVPVSVSIDAMISSFDKSSNCNIEIECNGNNIDNPKCGKKCTIPTNEYVEYSFNGEKFEIYGTIKANSNFEVSYNNQVITVDLSSKSPNENTKVYESSDLDYGTYNVKIKGIANNNFVLHKIAFYPSLKSVRINSTYLYTSKSWAIESDNIGGFRSYTNASDAYKSAIIECSKIWIYGSKDSTLGKLKIKFAKKDFDEISEYKDQQPEELALIYESEKVAFNKYELSINRFEKRALIYYIYYLFDGPEKTPDPTIDYKPDSKDSYIDKTLETLKKSK